MKGFCLFSGSKVTNNEKFRKQLQAKNKCLLGLILLGIIVRQPLIIWNFQER